MDMSFLDKPAFEVAPRLLGCILQRQIGSEIIAVKIVETEAYDQSDAASHSYRGQTPRTAVMFGPSGYLYVYFTYGMHYCMNIVTEPANQGSAVLIRAVEPQTGVAVLARNRSARTSLNLTNGPAKLCQALAIDRTFNGHQLDKPPLTLQFEPPLAPEHIVQTTRIGITRDIEKPWRFYIQGNPYVSKPVSA